MRPRTQTAVRRKPDSKKTRDAIMKAALSVFLEKGYGPATVEEIAEKAGTAKGTVFHHFKSKLGLLVEVFRAHSVIEDLPELSRDGMKDWADERVLSYVANISFVHAEKNLPLRRLWMLEALRLSGKSGLFYRNIADPAIRSFEKFIADKQKVGEFRHLDPYVVSVAFLGSLFAIRFWHELMLGNELRPVPREKWVGQLTDLFLNGLRVDKSRIPARASSRSAREKP